MFDAAEDDKAYQEVKGAILTGLPCQSMPDTHPGRSLASVWDRISIFKDTLLCIDGKKIIVPPKARADILATLHLPHAGLSKMRQNAAELFFWPGMNADIKNLVESCTACQEIRPSQPQEPIQFGLSEEPMDQVGVDLLQAKGHHYLVMVDRYSGFPFAKEMKSLNTKAVTNQLAKWFHDFGYPRVLRSDNGPQFRSDFTLFCKENGIHHETSSPYNPMSNGLAEAAVKSVKYLIMKTANHTDFEKALLEFRNTPRMDKTSPAQLFLGRRQRTAVPSLQECRRPVDQDQAMERKRATQHAAETANPGVTLADLEVGTSVRVQNLMTRRWDQTGIIISTNHSGRSHHIHLDDDTVVRRNRCYIKPIPSEPVNHQDQPAPPTRSCQHHLPSGA